MSSVHLLLNLLISNFFCKTTKPNGTKLGRDVYWETQICTNEIDPPFGGAKRGKLSKS
jgi:hypothetical protein